MYVSVKKQGEASLPQLWIADRILLTKPPTFPDDQVFPLPLSPSLWDHDKEADVWKRGEGGYGESWRKKHLQSRNRFAAICGEIFFPKGTAQTTNADREIEVDPIS